MKDDFKISKERIIYAMIEATYIKAMGGEAPLDLEKYKDYFPQEWFIIKNYPKKIKILDEAIQKKCLIIDTLGYQDIIEGVKNFKSEEEEK